MEASIAVIGLMAIFIGFFIPIVGILLIICGIVLMIAGLSTNSSKEDKETKVMRKRCLCRVCKQPITKIQAESLGLCQECFDAEYKSIDALEGAIKEAATRVYG